MTRLLRAARLALIAAAAIDVTWSLLRLAAELLHQGESPRGEGEK